MLKICIAKYLVFALESQNRNFTVTTVYEVKTCSAALSTDLFFSELHNIYTFIVSIISIKSV